MIDLRVETVTRGTAATPEAMVRAEPGDEGVGEGTTLREQEARMGELPSKERAHLRRSGTLPDRPALA